jgi:glycosyltransferase involved in cell wall biosynthesis
LREAGLETGILGWAARAILHYIRMWDFSAAGRVDHFIAPSRWTADCVWRVYRRRSSVIYPPVDIERFNQTSSRGDHYVVVSRLVSHKKVDLIVDAFSQLGLPLIVVGDGPEWDRVSERAAANVRMMGRQSDSTVQEILESAKAFIHMAEDDFGIAPVEAQAAGCPVIAYGRGGVLETVVEGQTGLFFQWQRVDCLKAAVLQFERGDLKFNAQRIRQNAARFNKERFQRELTCLVERRWDRWIHRWRGRSLV